MSPESLGKRRIRLLLRVALRLRRGRRYWLKWTDCDGWVLM